MLACLKQGKVRLQLPVCPFDTLACVCPAYLTNWTTTQRAGRRGAFDVYSCYTCSLYGRTWNAGLICSHILSTRQMCFSRRVRLLLIVIAAGVSVSAETRKPIYRIRRYCKAASEYSPIRSIGLTLVFVPIALDTCTMLSSSDCQMWTEIKFYIHS